MDAAVQGLMLGLSAGPFCLATCAPIFVPFIMAEERNFLQNAATLGELALGRLIAYLLFGIAVGYAGAKLNGPWFDKVIGISMILLSSIMLLFVASRKMPHLSLCKIGDKYSRFPAIFGFLTGINLCPPFLLAISSAAGMGSLWGSIMLFGGFFSGTTIFLILLMPLGILGAYEPVRITGLMAIILSSIFFLGLGIAYLI